MDNVALLTPAHLESSLGSVPLSQLLPLLPAALQEYHLLLHQQLGTLCFWAYHLSSAALLWAYFLSSTALLWALEAMSFLAQHAALVAKLGVAASNSTYTLVWSSKGVQALRKKLFHEFALFILGSGNSVVLVVFWPGWIVVGAGVLAVRAVSG